MSVIATQARPALQTMQHPHDFRLNSMQRQDPILDYQKHLTFRQHVQNARHLPTPSHAVPLPLNSPRSAAPSSLHRASFGGGTAGARPEDLLRRKTPGGTINSAYNGSLAEPSNLRGHATKHMIISCSRAYDQEGSRISGVGDRTRRSTHIFSNLQAWPNDQVQVDSMVGLSPSTYGAMDWQYINQPTPRVMQPPQQAGVGPTASNEHSPFGPYWPNGEFAPYKPAPFTEYHSQHAPSTWQSGHSSFPTNQPHGAFNKTNSSYYNTDYVNSGSSQDLNLGRSTSGSRPDLAGGPHLTPPHDKLSFSARTRLLAQSSTQSSQSPSASWQQRVSHNLSPAATTYSLGFDPSLANLSQTDILAWAYWIYNDLVGTVRESRRAAAKAVRELQQRGETVTNVLARSSQLGSKHSPFPSLQLNVRDTMHGFDGHGKASLGQSSSFQNGLPWSPTRDPKKEAYLAINTLNTLCSQGKHDWIDGMLLNGCLSHVLGEHQNAARWFSRILHLDKNHVEAYSNLASSYLALNRRAEAEDCWRAAVRARPTYFEALEHLIGLLCHDKRNKEATQIIDQVQEILRCRVRPDSLHQMSRYAVGTRENGRLMALIHAKGNLMYNMQDQLGAAKAFEEVVLIAVGCSHGGIEALIKHVLIALSTFNQTGAMQGQSRDFLLLPPGKALQTAKLCFPNSGDLPGLELIETPVAKKAAISVTSNSLLSLAKIFQDGMNPNASAGFKSSHGIEEILSLYYLSLSLQPSPSTANNVGILLAGIQPTVTVKPLKARDSFMFPGVMPGSGVALALTYYKYGLDLDSKHAHLYTNLGSLLKDIGQLPIAVEMYEKAVACDANFDIALANLANAVKDQGRVTDAIYFYRRAVQVNPKFAEAVCGLANALNSICEWSGRGGVWLCNGMFDRYHVAESGELIDSKPGERNGSGWAHRVVEIVDNQLREGRSWGRGVLRDDYVDDLSDRLGVLERRRPTSHASRTVLEPVQIRRLLESWRGQDWEGALILSLVERATRMITWQWYHDRYTTRHERAAAAYHRPKLPAALSVLGTPTVLPFHTFTLPMTAKQVRQISQRNGLRVSCSTLRSSWLPQTVFPPPAPPAPTLKIGYVSSDFNNHPLAHLMQSVFGMHDSSQFTAYCYATSASDNSVHRQRIESESPQFIDASSWPVERLVRQIVEDGIHILINLNGYTRGARNEIFAARPAPVQMSFMGFAGSLGAEWCDYLLADEIAVPQNVLRPYRSNVDVTDVAMADNYGGNDEWVYPENIVYTRHAFFCCDHAQSACTDPIAERRLTWNDELVRRWRMRKELFPDLPSNTVIFANFNQLYKIDPTTFRTWLRILSRVPNAILWLLRFPADGARNLLNTARAWGGDAVANRIRFTDVAPKGQHIARACVADLFLDTSECNAHTTAADCLWSGTPLLTLPRYEWKMCSRMAAGILGGALDLDSPEGQLARNDLVAESEDDYEQKAIALASGLTYTGFEFGGDIPNGVGRLAELRRMLWEGRWTSKLFDTRRWVRDLELAYTEVWRRWVEGEGGDIWIQDLIR